MWWQIGAVANGIVAAAYLAIAAAIVWPLVRTGQLKTNRLGAATLASARHMISKLLDEGGASAGLSPGQLLRRRPVTIGVPAAGPRRER